MLKDDQRALPDYRQWPAFARRGKQVPAARYQMRHGPRLLDKLAELFCRSTPQHRHDGMRIVVARRDQLRRQLQTARLPRTAGHEVQIAGAVLPSTFPARSKGRARPGARLGGQQGLGDGDR